jgi:hypothetical protein
MSEVNSRLEIEEPMEGNFSTSCLNVKTSVCKDDVIEGESRAVKLIFEFRDDNGQRVLRLDNAVLHPRIEGGVSSTTE